MTTKPWADEPFQLIATPSKRPELAYEKHSYIHVSSEMANAHNVIIRGLNAIMQQAPYVKISTDPAYNQKDVQDLLFYVSLWVEMVQHHHSNEESFIFPELEKFSGKPGLLDDSKHQYKLLRGGLERLLAYTQATNPQDYRWDGSEGMEKIIDSFSKDLIDHLHAEVEVFLAMKDLDSAGLSKTWDQGTAIAKKAANLSMLYNLFPFVLGTADKTYEGGNEFPSLPWIVPYLIKYWFAAGNGAWRFNPCDFWSQPRPFAFGPGQQS